METAAPTPQTVPPLPSSGGTPVAQIQPTQPVVQQPLGQQGNTQTKDTGDKTVLLGVGAGIGIALLVLIVMFGLLYLRSANELQVADQVYGNTVQIKKITIRDPHGGYVAIKPRGSGDSSPLIGQSGYLPPGSYDDFGIEIRLLDDKGKDIAGPGEYYYVILYGESGASLGLDTATDVMLKDLLGRYLIRRFRLR